MVPHPACRTTAGRNALSSVRRAVLPLVLAVLLTGCATPAPPEPMAASFTLATDVPSELATGALLVDVRGPTERGQDGVPRLSHHWLAFGPDRWRRLNEAETQDFLGQISRIIGPPGPRLLVLCSVGIRSEAAARALVAAGYDADVIMDGWLGNDMGAGLRATGR